MSAIQIKCYLLTTNVESNIATSELIGKASEIRRFALAQTGYAKLVEKIKSAYGQMLDDVEMKTYWLDEENELVCFSTDAEMQYAVDLQAAIRLSELSNPYKTMVNIFKVYVMRKEASKETKCSASSSNEDDASVRHPGVICDGCQSGISGPRWKCNTCPDYDLCSPCKDKGIHTEHEFAKIARPGRGGKCPWAGGRRNGGGCHQSGWKHRFFNQQHQHTSPTTTSPLHETLNQFLPHLASSMPIVSDSEQLKNVGEYLKQFLDPFGIDVSYYVDSLSRQSTASKKEEEKTTTAKKEETPMETASTSTKTDDVIPVKDDLIDLKQSTIVTESVQVVEPSAPSPFESASNALKQVVLENETPKIPLIRATESPAKKDEEFQGFNLVDMEKEIRFINCIEHLKSMGYNDDSGWLTRLVVAKDGNINNILDSLHPSKN